MRPNSVFALLLVTSAVLVSTAPHLATQGRAPQAAAYVDGEVLIKFHRGADAGTKGAARALVNAVRLELVDGRDGGDLERAALPRGLAVALAVGRLRAHPAVAYAEPNWILTHDAAANDPYVTNGSLWGMYGDSSSPANPYGSQAAEAWSAGATGVPTVYVGIIDEGIDINHPDLVDNIWTNTAEIADGKDNDGNGYVDDIHGWDFVSNNNSVYDGAPGNTSTDSHGTHVAGTIGASGDNGTGVAGVNWQVSMISGKFLGPNGGSTSNAVKALNYMVDLKQRHGLNIVATNNSWGGGGYSQSLHDAILRSAKAGILFIAAAGNNGTNNDTTARYPTNYNTTVGTSTESAASYDAVIAVASITSSGARSSFSNYGATTVDLGAPGSGIYSTTPQNTYSSFSGTSMATPHVAGAAALYASLNPLATAANIRTALLNSAVATPTSSLNGATVTNGRLNISHFISTPPPPPPALPSAPSGLGASVTAPTTITLNWTDTSNNESGFRIERCTGATCTDFASLATVGANTTQYVNDFLGSNVTYRYRVKAYNGDGDSAYSNIAAATTPAAGPPPAAPSGLTATGGVRQITLQWADNSNNETGFSIERCQGSPCSNFSVFATVGANVTSFVDTTARKNRSLTYRVRATGAAGNSGYSNTVSATAQ